MWGPSCRMWGAQIPTIMGLSPLDVQGSHSPLHKLMRLSEVEYIPIKVPVLFQYGIDTFYIFFHFKEHLDTFSSKTWHYINGEIFKIVWTNFKTVRVYYTQNKQYPYEKDWLIINGIKLCSRLGIRLCWSCKKHLFVWIHDPMG